MKKEYQIPQSRVILIDPEELLNQMVNKSGQRGVVYPTNSPEDIIVIDNDKYNNQQGWNQDNEGNEIGISAD